jgi:hypothetical protein
MHTPPATRPPRRWLDLRWITAAVVTLAISSMLWGLFGPEPQIVVSRETTFITEPLAPDALPDYRGHVLALYGAAPPPDENAAVLLLQVFWPLEMKSPSPELKAVCQALGIPDTPPADPPLLNPDDDPVVKAAIEKSAIGSIEAARTQPWKGSDLPELEAWIEQHNPAINRLLEASRRPHYWFVSPTLLMPKQEILFAVLLPEIQSFPQAGHALACRAMWHLGAGRTREAWDDILGIHRLSRLIAPAREKAGFLVSHLVAIAVAGRANKATRHLLAMPDLGENERAIIHRDLADLAPLGSIAESLALERLLAIDTAIAFPSTRRGSRRQQLLTLTSISALTSMSGGDPSLFVFSTSLDWNVVLNRLNAAYDELEAAASLPTAAARQAELKRLEAARPSALRSSGWLAAAGHLLNLLASRPERSEHAAGVIESLVMPGLSTFSAKADSAKAEFDALVKEAAGPTP